MRQSMGVLDYAADAALMGAELELSLKDVCDIELRSYVEEDDGGNIEVVITHRDIPCMHGSLLDSTRPPRSNLDTVLAQEDVSVFTLLETAEPEVGCTIHHGDALHGHKIEYEVIAISVSSTYSPFKEAYVRRRPLV